MLYNRRHHLLVPIPACRTGNYLHGRLDLHVLLPHCDRRLGFRTWREHTNGHRYSAGHLNALQHDHCWTSLLPHRGGDAIRKAEVQNSCHRPHRVQPDRHLHELRHASHAFYSL